MCNHTSTFSESSRGQSRVAISSRIVSKQLVIKIKVPFRRWLIKILAKRLAGRASRYRTENRFRKRHRVIINSKRELSRSASRDFPALRAATREKVIKIQKSGGASCTETWHFAYNFPRRVLARYALIHYAITFHCPTLDEITLPPLILHRGAPLDLMAYFIIAARPNIFLSHPCNAFPVYLETTVICTVVKGVGENLRGDRDSIERLLIIFISRDVPLGLLRPRIRDLRGFSRRKLTGC